MDCDEFVEMKKGLDTADLVGKGEKNQCFCLLGIQKMIMAESECVSLEFKGECDWRERSYFIDCIIQIFLD